MNEDFLPLQGPKQKRFSRVQSCPLLLQKYALTKKSPFVTSKMSNTPHSYIQGHSDHTTSTQQTRTAESDAGFLIPHIKKTDKILDVGCGPGTITLGLAKYASEGSTIGIDISPEVLEKARAFASESNAHDSGPGSIIFEEANILQRLPYLDDTFDIVFSAHVFGHLPMPDLPLQALAEMRRVLKPGGILATRDAASQHAYPSSLDLDRLWVERFEQAVNKGKPAVDPTGPNMPALVARAGFDAEGGKVRVSGGTLVYSSPQERRWLAKRIAGQLGEGDAFRKSWLEAGISEGEIRETINAVKTWSETEGAWHGSLQCQILVWK